MVVNGLDRKLQLVAYFGCEGLKDLYNDWLQLINHISNLCFSHFPQWYDAYLNRTSEAKDSLLFCALYRGSMLVAVFPLVSKTEKPFGLMALAVPSGKLLWMPDFIVAEEEDSAELFQFLCENISSETGIKWDLIKIDGTLETSHASRCLSGKAGLCTFSKITATCNTLILMPYEQSLHKYSKNFKARLRKARNKLVKLENIDFHKVHKPEELAWAFDEFMTLEASGWKGSKQKIKGHEAGSAIALHETKRKFYERLVRDLGDYGIVEINLLRIGKKTIAAQLALVIRDTCYLLKITYDEGYAALSPGNMLLEYLLKGYEGDALVKYVCLITNYPWHMDWKPMQLRYMNYMYFNKTQKGLLAYSILKLNEAGKNLLRKVKKDIATLQRSVAGT